MAMDNGEEAGFNDEGRAPFDSKSLFSSWKAKSILAVALLVVTAVAVAVPLSLRDNDSSSPSSSKVAAGASTTLRPVGYTTEVPSASPIETPIASTSLPTAEPTPSPSTSPIETSIASTSLPTAEPTPSPSTSPIETPIASTSPPTAEPAERPVGSVTAEGPSTSDTFVMQWVSRGFTRYITNLRPPTVTATCGTGGFVDLVATSDTDISCSKPSQNVLKCTSGNSVFTGQELLRYGDSGISATFTCMGSTGEAIMATVEISEETFSAQAQGSGSMSEMIARVHHQLRITRICQSNVVQGISACPSQADRSFGQCKDEGFCSDTCRNNSVCSCSLTVPAIKSYPQPIPKYDSNCLVATVGEGETCFADGMCSVDICLLGTCRAGLLEDTAVCENGRQCQSGYCEVFDTVDPARPLPTGCCGRGRWGSYDSTTRIPGTRTCSRLGSGMPCTGPNGCERRTCGVDGTCS